MRENSLKISAKSEKIPIKTLKSRRGYPPPTPPIAPPLDERQTKQFVCSCQNGYYGIYCERIDSQVHIEFSSSLSLKGN